MTTEKPSITTNVLALSSTPVALIILLILAVTVPSMAWLFVLYVLALPFAITYHIVKIVKKSRA
jgi:uncharacterized protein (DUF58 family)